MNRPWARDAATAGPLRRCDLDPRKVLDAQNAALERLVHIRSNSDVASAASVAIGALSGTLGFVRSALGEREIRTLLLDELACTEARLALRAAVPRYGQRDIDA